MKKIQQSFLIIVLFVCVFVPQAVFAALIAPGSGASTTPLQPIPQGAVPNAAGSIQYSGPDESPKAPGRSTTSAVDAVQENGEEAGTTSSVSQGGGLEDRSIGRFLAYAFFGIAVVSVGAVWLFRKYKHENN